MTCLLPEDVGPASTIEDAMQNMKDRLKINHPDYQLGDDTDAENRQHDATAIREYRAAELEHFAGLTYNDLSPANAIGESGSAHLRGWQGPPPSNAPIGSSPEAVPWAVTATTRPMQARTKARPLPKPKS